MNEKKLLAVVITTYNNPKSLELCLTTLKNQTYQNFEVYIADDGSGDETRDLLLRMKRECDFMLYHIWHPDQGYQKAKINNIVFKQIDAVKFPVVVCIDHDVILHPYFLEDHYLAHERENFQPLLFMGRRIDLSPELTESLTPENVTAFARGPTLQLFKATLQGKTRNFSRAFRFDLSPGLAHLFKRDRVYDLLGSNYSISTQALIQVNGYNEDFKSYWGEDGDLFVRVRNSGIKLQGRTSFAIQWHLYHKRLQETPEHVANYQTLIKNTDYRRCKNGIQKDK